MDLVNTYHGDLPAKLGKVLKEEPFWGDKQDFDALVFHCLEDLLLNLVLLLGVDTGSGEEVWQLHQLV